MLGRGDEDVMCAQDVRELVRWNRRDVTYAVKLARRVADEGELVAIPVEVVLQPCVGRSSLALVVRPGRRDETRLAVPTEGHPTFGVEDAVVAAVVDHVRIDELDADLPVHVDRSVGDGYRRVGQPRVHLRDARVGAVVEPAVERRDRADTVHHPSADQAPRKQVEPGEVEVEGVEEDRARRRRDRVHADPQATALELGDDRTKRLVAAPGRRRRELVEDCNVHRAHAGEHRVPLEFEPPCSPLYRPEQHDGRG